MDRVEREEKRMEKKMKALIAESIVDTLRRSTESSIWQGVRKRGAASSARRAKSPVRRGRHNAERHEGLAGRLFKSDMPESQWTPVGKRSLPLFDPENVHTELPEMAEPSPVLRALHRPQVSPSTKRLLRRVLQAIPSLGTASPQSTAPRVTTQPAPPLACPSSNEIAPSHRGASSLEPSSNVARWHGRRLNTQASPAARPTTARPTTARPTTARPTTARPHTVRPPARPPTGPPTMDAWQMPTLGPTSPSPPSFPSPQERATALPAHGPMLYIVGDGELALQIAKMWQRRGQGRVQLHPCSPAEGGLPTHVYTEAGVQVHQRGQSQAAQQHRHSRQYVMVCPNSPEELDTALVACGLELWASIAGGAPICGGLVAVSSTAVYAPAQGTCTEHSELSEMPVARRLRCAERALISAGGSVVRLPELYDQGHGAHLRWIEQGVIEADPGGEVHLLHFDDAVALCLAALRAPNGRQVYLGSTTVACSRLQLVAAALRASGAAPTHAMPATMTFKSKQGPLVLQSAWTRRTLQWVPQWECAIKFLGHVELRIQGTRRVAA